MGFKAWQFSLGVIALAGSAVAQDGTEIATSRTPANAQKFIAITPPESFQIGAENAVIEGEVTSPDICTTAMSGTRVTFDGVKYVAFAAKKDSRPTSYGVMEGRKFVTVTNGFIAGLRAGDEIVSVNGEPITSHDDLNRALVKHAVSGGPAKFKLQRDGVIYHVAETPKFAPEIITETPDAPKPVLQLIIDWSKVQGVESGGNGNFNFVKLKTPNNAGSEQKYLFYAVPETRDRVLAAAQYLKTACDQSAELGF